MTDKAPTTNPSAMDTVERLRAEAEQEKPGFGSWRENDRRLIWCGRKNEGAPLEFHNTTRPDRHGPKISEAQAAQFLADEGPWLRPRKVTEAG